MAYAAAPERKPLFSIAVFVLGAKLAGYFLAPSCYPESCPEKAYQPTHLPIAATYAGGLFGLLIRGAFRLRSGAGSGRAPDRDGECDG